MNNRGEEELMSLWWFVVLAIVTVGIVAGVSVFYSGDLNIRENEAEILHDKIFDCLVDEGYLRSDLKAEFDIFSECGLERTLFDKKGSDFYFLVEIFGLENKMNFESGDRALVSDCKIEKTLIARNYPVCVESKRSVLRQGDAKFLEISIIGISNNEGGIFYEK